MLVVIVGSGWVGFGGWVRVFPSSSSSSMHIQTNKVTCVMLTHLFRADGSGKRHAARPLPTRNAVADRVVD